MANGFILALLSIIKINRFRLVRDHILLGDTGRVLTGASVCNYSTSLIKEFVNLGIYSTAFSKYLKVCWNFMHILLLYVVRCHLFNRYLLPKISIRKMEKMYKIKMTSITPQVFKVIIK